MKNIIFLVIVALIFSCNQNKKEEIQINKENYKRVYDDPIEDSLQPFLLKILYNHFGIQTRLLIRKG